LSGDKTGLHRLFQALAQHSDLLAEAYFAGAVEPNEANQRALNQLKQLKVLSNHGGQGFRLSSRLGQFLDGALNSDRMRRLDTDLGSWVDLLEQQIGLYRDAFAEDRLEDCDAYLAEIERLVFDLSDTLEESTAYLAMLVNSRFANVRTLGEKKRQNVFYIGRLEKLVGAVSALQPAVLLELADDHEGMQSLIDRQLVRNLPVHRQRLQDILDILKTFLFQIRQIEARARLVRGFAFFLRQNPDYAPRDWSEQEQVPAHWNRIQGLVFRAHPDTRDRGMEQALVEIARKVKSDGEALLAPKPARRLNGVSLARRAPVRLDSPAYRKRLHELFAQVRQTPGLGVSALAFRERHVPEIAAPLWLSCVLGEGIRRKAQRSGYDFEMVCWPGDGFDGNRRVKDLRLVFAPPGHG
jgi:hypothetical protein